MALIRDKKRELRSVKEIEIIDNIFNKYIDTSNLFLKSGYNNDYITFVDRVNSDELLLTFSHEITEKEVTLYTIVSNRYVEFKLTVVSKMGDPYPPCTYKLKINASSLAMVKRESRRVSFDQDKPRITHIAVSKVRETEAELKKSISVQVIIKDYVDRIEGYDLKRIFYRDDDDLPLEVQFTVKKGESLFIPDLKNVKEFLKNNDAYMRDEFMPNFKSNLEVELRKLSMEYASLVIYIVNYAPLTAEVFPVCYVMLGTKDRVIDADEFDKINFISGGISDKIRKGNYREFETEGVVINLSLGGALVELKDSELIRQLSILDGILFNLVFKLRDPVRISASVVFIQQNDEGSYHAGLQFKGSYFGKEIRKVIEERLKSAVPDY